MKILILSQKGDGQAIGQRLIQEGHEVRIFYQHQQMVPRNIVPTVTSWREYIAWCDLVVQDAVGYEGREATIRAFGKPILGMGRVEGAGPLNLPEGVQAANFEDLYSDIFSRPWQDGWQLYNDDFKLNVNEKEDLIFAHEYFKVGPLKARRLVDGVKCRVTGWWNGRMWLTPFMLTFRQDYELNGNLGRAVECMSNVVLTLAPDSRLASEVFKPLGPGLMSSPYRGPVEINLRVTDKVPYAWSAGLRFKPDTIEAVLEGLREETLGLLLETAYGVKKEILLSEDTLICARLIQPEVASGEPILGLDDEARKHVWFSNVYQDGEGVLRTTGSDGTILKVTARGRQSPEKGQHQDYVKEAVNRAYRTLETIRFRQKAYRTDLGAGVNESMAHLKQWGWL